LRWERGGIATRNLNKEWNNNQHIISYIMSSKVHSFFRDHSSGSCSGGSLVDYLELIESFSQQKITTIDTLHYYLLKITQICSQRHRSKLISQDLFELFLKWFHDFLVQNFSLGLQYLLRYLLDLFLSDDQDSQNLNTAADPFWKYFLNRFSQPSESFLCLLLKCHTIYQHDIAIPKLISYLLKYFVEKDSERNLLEDTKGYSSDQRQGQGQEEQRAKQWSQFLEEVILILMKKECSLSMMFNYARCLHWLPEAKRRNEKLIVNGLNRILSSLYSTHASVPCVSLRISSTIHCSELESYLILSALALFHTWPSLSHDGYDRHTKHKIHFEILCDQLMVGLHSYYRNARLCLLVCLSLKAALEKERISSPSSDPHLGHSLTEYCIDRWNLLDQLVAVIRHHANKYRIVVTALECFYLLTRPSPTCALFQIRTPNSPPPSTDERDSSSSFSVSVSSSTSSLSSSSSSSPSLFPSLFPSSDDRVSLLISLWSPFVTSHYYSHKWNQRKAFCLFLVCCCRSSCVFGNWTVRKEQKQLVFPSLDLIFSSIVPMRKSPCTPSSGCASNALSRKQSEKVKLVEKIFFSKFLCVQISSYL
jgi:hypothetical protein